MPTTAPTEVQYMCTYCGKKMWKKIGMGRPMPGDCPRRPKMSNGVARPHVWVVNRKM